MWEYMVWWQKIAQTIKQVIFVAKYKLLRLIHEEENFEQANSHWVMVKKILKEDIKMALSPAGFIASLFKPLGNLLLEQLQSI